MTKQRVKEFIKELPVFISLIVIIVGLITWLVTLDNKVGAIEKDHMIFGEFYQHQIDEIKNSQIRTEQKMDRIIERFMK